jgi:hypothetical protein
MKSYSFFSFLLFLTTISSCFAQDSLSLKRVNIIKVDLSYPVTGLVQHSLGLKFAYERSIGKQQSFELMVKYGDFVSDYQVSSFLGTAMINGTVYNHKEDRILSLVEQYRYYCFHKRQCQGLYIGAYLRYSYEDYYWHQNDGNSQYFDFYDKLHSLSIGMHIGYQQILGKHIVIDCDLGAGGSFLLSENKQLIMYPPGGSVGSPYSQTDFLFLLGVGYNF